MNRVFTTDPLRVAVAGLGTVGTGVVQLINAQASLLTQRCGRLIEITAVSARNPQKSRDFSLEKMVWFEDPVAMAAQAKADVIIELIGGAKGIAEKICTTALSSGRHVVTANKAMMAEQGLELAKKAEAAGRGLAMEAAIAGGIPIVKTIREGLVANKIIGLAGILNGTCNYILTQMRQTGDDFDTALAEAQRLGYAETDPTMDIDGTDTAHKLALLTALSYGCSVDFSAIHIEGIKHITIQDIAYAQRLGYRIKLLGITRHLSDGRIEQRVHPCLVPIALPIAAIEGIFNAIEIAGDFVGGTLLVGQGAGANPTASAVVADLIDIARGKIHPSFGIPSSQLDAIQTRPMGAHIGAYYLRLSVLDQAGVIADITAAFRDFGVSLESVLQPGHSPGEIVSVVLTTHRVQEASLKKALERITLLPTIMEPPRLIRIEPVVPI